ncbi:hypothetical protein LA080_011602 [Diaporthe eres]|nr:hypothetical protein LA080_011602 [Diaporthe eres]
MQFSVKTILAVAVSMTTLASAAPQAMELAVGDTTLAGGDVVAEGDPNDKGIYTCCAFKDCTVCADYGHINDCSPCGGWDPGNLSSSGTITQAEFAREEDQKRTRHR